MVGTGRGQPSRRSPSDGVGRRQGQHRAAPTAAPGRAHGGTGPRSDTTARYLGRHPPEPAPPPPAALTRQPAGQERHGRDRPALPVPRPPRPAVAPDRGGALEAPENTWTSFTRAHDLGFHFMETDVHASKDGVVAAIHDPDLIPSAASRVQA